MKITQVVRRSKLRFITTMALAVAGLLIPASQMASAGAATARSVTQTGTKPSIVLVHGAWADSSSWAAVTARLQRDGYTVYVPPNPLLGLSYDSAFLRDFLNTISGPVVLVGTPTAARSSPTPRPAMPT